MDRRSLGPLGALFLLVVPFLVAGCVAEPPPGPAPEPDPMAPSCGAEGLQGLVGQPRAVLQTMKFAAPTRIIEPGMAVTMDYSPDRLNLWIGEDGRIRQVTCG